MFATSRKSSDPTRRIQPTQAARKPGSVLTGSPPCTCSHLPHFQYHLGCHETYPIGGTAKSVAIPGAVAPYLPGRMLSMLDMHHLRNLVPCPQDDIAMHLPAQALTKSSDLTYPKAKGKLAQGARCRSGQLSGLALSTIRSPSSLGSQDFTELLCTNIRTRRTMPFSGSAKHNPSTKHESLSNNERFRMTEGNYRPW